MAESNVDISHFNQFGFNPVKPNVAVATYNMSYVSDKLDDLRTMQFASEAAFLSSNKELINLISSNENYEVPQDLRRQYWNNAKELLLSFFSTHEIEGLTCVVGLQEMNKTVPDEPLTGSAAIDDMLEFFNDYQDKNKKYKTNYIQVCESVPVKKTDKKNVTTVENLALSIIYDQNVFGAKNITKTQIWDNEGKGRPTLMVVTENNYVFISTHGTNAKLGADTDKSLLLNEFNNQIVKNNKTKVEAEINARLTELQLNSLNVSDIFVMGDLNDRFDKIQEFNIAGKKLKYNGFAPRSCCYNWDSSCSEKRYRQLELAKDLGYCDDIYVDKNDKTNKIIKDRQLPYGEEIIKFKLPMNEEEGFVKNYRYRGDKVFGATPVGDIQIFDYENRLKLGQSMESDHEMVFATFVYQDLFPDAVLLGGRRRRVLNGRGRKSASRKRKSASRKRRSRGRKTKGGKRKAGKRRTYKMRR